MRVELLNLKGSVNFSVNHDLPRGSDEFVIYYDASWIGLGCVLMTW